MNQPQVALELHEKFSAISVRVVNVASYDNYMPINSYLAVCFLLFFYDSLIRCILN